MTTSTIGETMFKKTIADAKALTSTNHEVTIKVDPDSTKKVCETLNKSFAILCGCIVATSIVLRAIDAKYPSSVTLND